MIEPEFIKNMRAAGKVPAPWIVTRVCQSGMTGGWSSYGATYNDEAEARTAHEKPMKAGELSSELQRWDDTLYRHVRVAFRKNNGKKRR